MEIFKELAKKNSEFRRNVLRRISQIIIGFLIIALCIFIPAGSIDWPYAWIYLIIFLFVPLINFVNMPADALDVVAERGSIKENVETWDRVLTKFIMIFGLLIYIVSGLDFRWGWSAFLAWGWHLVAIVIFILGLFLTIWSMLANSFFSTAVRIQLDRGHTVCSNGPYKYVRHPGYLGMILYYTITPIILGTLWALIPSVATGILFVIRTWLEDKTLMKKLPGYVEYARSTKYRLFPGIW